MRKVEKKMEREGKGGEGRGVPENLQKICFVRWWGYIEGGGGGAYVLFILCRIDNHPNEEVSSLYSKGSPPFEWARMLLCSLQLGESLKKILLYRQCTLHLFGIKILYTMQRKEKKIASFVQIWAKQIKWKRCEKQHLVLNQSESTRQFQKHIFCFPFLPQKSASIFFCSTEQTLLWF